MLELHAVRAHRGVLFRLPVDREIVRMHQAFKGLGLGRKGLPREAEDLVDALGPDQVLAGGIVFPVTEADDALGILEPRQVKIGQLQVELDWLKKKVGYHG